MGSSKLTPAISKHVVDHKWLTYSILRTKVPHNFHPDNSQSIWLSLLTVSPPIWNLLEWEFSRENFFLRPVGIILYQEKVSNRKLSEWGFSRRPVQEPFTRIFIFIHMLWLCVVYWNVNECVNLLYVHYNISFSFLQVSQNELPSPPSLSYFQTLGLLKGFAHIMSCIEQPTHR